MKATALLLAACCLAATALPGIAAQATATLEGMNEASGLAKRGSWGGRRARRKAREAVADCVPNHLHCQAAPSTPGRLLRPEVTAEWMP